MATAASGHQCLTLQTGAEDPFMGLIDELHVISENEGGKKNSLIKICLRLALIDPLQPSVHAAKGRLIEPEKQQASNQG